MKIFVVSFLFFSLATASVTAHQSNRYHQGQQRKQQEQNNQTNLNTGDVVRSQLQRGSLLHRLLQVVLFIIQSRQNHHELSEAKYGWIHDEVKDMCKKLNISVPPLRLHRNRGVFNAYASSLLPSFAVVVIGQRLLREMNEEEVIAIVGHELGHVEKSHVLKNVIGGLVGATLMWQGRNKLCDEYAPDDDEWAKRLGITAACVVTLTMILAKMSRIFEKQADMVSARKLGKTRGLINAMKRFAQMHEKGSTAIDNTIKDFWHLFDGLPVINLLARICLALTQGAVGTIRFVKPLFATHPAPQERVVYLKDVLKEQEKVQQVAA